MNKEVEMTGLSMTATVGEGMEIAELDKWAEVSASCDYEEGK